MELINTVIGAEKKLNLNIEPINEFTMDDYDISVELFTTKSNIVTLTKGDLVREDQSNYIVPVETAKIGCGRLKCRVIAHIPDTDFYKNYRVEIQDFVTNLNIIERL